jgi:hypothetical protein
MAGGKPKQPGKFKYFFQRLCRPLHRKLGSYLEASSNVEERQEPLWFGNDSIIPAQHDTFYDQLMVCSYGEAIAGRQSRGDYHTIVPIHPASRSQTR